MTNGKNTKRQTTIDKTYTYNQRSSYRNPTKNGSEIMCSGRVSSSFSTSGTRRVNLVTNQLVNHDMFVLSVRVIVFSGTIGIVMCL